MLGDVCGCTQDCLIGLYTQVYSDSVPTDTVGDAVLRFCIWVREDGKLPGAVCVALTIDLLALPTQTVINTS